MQISQHFALRLELIFVRLNRALQMKVTQEEIENIQKALVPTWQSVVAVAYHARIKPKRALGILKYFRDTLGAVEMRDCRLDGHNPVWMVRPKERDKTTSYTKEKLQPCLSLELEM